MPTGRLYQQFQRLAQLLGSDEREISLAEVADLLCCTPRNARLLLRRMQDQGWLSWSAEAGRGRRSRLTLLDSQESLTRRRLRDLLSQGQLAQAVRLAEDRLDLLTPLLIEQLGQATREGRQILRVPYYRPLPQLLPTGPMRRSEIHLSRQIFNGLTRRNEENGEIEGDLAHHWECLGPCHWRFYLRPAVRFHHGRELVVEDVMESLLALRDRPLFAHLDRLESPWPRTLDLYLDSPDPWLPHLLAEPVATILPRELKGEAGFALQPVGTGPYRVAANDPLHLCLAAFDDYFGLRALLDEIDIWMLPELAERLETHLQLGRDSPELGTMRGESELESGCYFLLQDDRSGSLQDPALRQWRASGEEPGPRALLARVQQQSWFVPLFHHWLELESRVGVHGVRMTALGWFDFRSAWLRPEPPHQPAEAP